MGKRFGIWAIVVFIALVLTACGKNETQALIENAETLQAWYKAIIAEGTEINLHQEYVEQFVSVHEADIDYGLAYGITAILCEELELCEVNPDYTNEELAAYFSDENQMYLLDFTLPMFETYFFDEDTVAYVQAAAISFAEYMNAQGELDELYQICLSNAEEDATKLVEMKNEWLDAIGVDKEYMPFAELTFAYNDTKLPEEYPYVLTDAEANWYFHPADVKEYGYKAFFEEYQIVEKLMPLDFADARELFEAYLPEDVEPVDICTMFYKNDAVENGLYRIKENHIELFDDWEMAKYALLHEYVHYLTMGQTELCTTGWVFAEGVAEEAAVWGCENYLRAEYLREIYDADQMRELHIYDEEKECASNEKLVYATANSLYFGKMEGLEYYTVTYELKKRPDRIKTFSELSYEEVASITSYLIEKYGRDAVYKGYYNYDSFIELIGKEFIELYDEWGAWNKEQCNKLGLQFVYD